MLIATDTFQFTDWRENQQLCAKSDDWLAALSRGYFHLDGISCAELVEQIIDSGLFQGKLGLNQIVALNEAARGADKLPHLYHSGRHVNEVLLSAIAIMDRYQQRSGVELSVDFIFALVGSVLQHDADHPGQKLSVSGVTEGNSIYQGVKTYYRNLSADVLEPMIPTIFATAGKHFPNAEELQSRIEEFGKPIRQLRPDLHPVADDHMLMAEMMGMADLLPSLSSAQKLGLGAVAFIHESGFGLTLENAQKAADGFLDGVAVHRDVFAAHGIEINFDQLRSDLRVFPIKSAMLDYIDKIQATGAATPVPQLRVLKPANKPA